MLVRCVISGNRLYNCVPAIFVPTHLPTIRKLTGKIRNIYVHIGIFKYLTDALCIMIIKYIYFQNKNTNRDKSTFIRTI